MQWMNGFPSYECKIVLLEIILGKIEKIIIHIMFAVCNLVRNSVKVVLEVCRARSNILKMRQNASTLHPSTATVPAALSQLPSAGSRACMHHGCSLEQDLPFSLGKMYIPPDGCFLALPSIEPKSYAGFSCWCSLYMHLSFQERPGNWVYGF